MKDEDISRMVVGINKAMKEAPDGNVNMYIAAQKTRPLSQFVILFAEAFGELLSNKDLGLNLTDVKVMFRLLVIMQYGNLLSFSQKGLAKELGMTQPMVSASLRKMKSVSLIMTDERGKMFLNPHIVTKGSLKKMKDAEAYELADDEGVQKNF